MPLAGWSWAKVTAHPSVPEHTFPFHSSFCLQSFKENEPKGTFFREYCFQTSLERLFINYKRKHVTFPCGLLLDHPSLDVQLLNFLSSCFYFLCNSLFVVPSFLPGLQIILSTLCLFYLDIDFLYFHLSDTLHLAAGPFVTMTTTSWCQQSISLLSAELNLIKCQGCCLSSRWVPCTRGRIFVWSLRYFVGEPRKANFFC